MKQQSTKQLRRRAWWWSLPLHPLGVLMIATAIVLFVLPMSHLELILRHRDLESVHQTLLHHGAWMLGLSTAIWATLYTTGSRLRRRRRVRMARVMQRQRGTAITEFLVILPILLLLIFGLAQLSVNLIGGVLFQIARYQAARTARVWLPEEAGSRQGVTNDIVKHRVRTAVASTMAPVAPADRMTLDINLGLSTSDLGDAEGFRNIMVRRYSPVSEGMIGMGDNDLNSVLGILSNSLTTESSIANALDTSYYFLRAARKFAAAFRCAEVSSASVSGDNVSVQFSYSHQQAMPYVGRIFGEKASNLSFGGGTGPVGGRVGYFVKWEATHSLPKARFNANPTAPTDRSACLADGNLGC